MCVLQKKSFPDYFNFSLDCQLEILCARYIKICIFEQKNVYESVCETLYILYNANINIKIYKTFFFSPLLSTRVNKF